MYICDTPFSECWLFQLLTSAPLNPAKLIIFITARQRIYNDWQLFSNNNRNEKIKKKEM